MEFAGIWKKREVVYAAPSYYAFQLYSTADIDHVVASENDAGKYQVKEGISRLPDIKHVPYLDIVAAVNKDATRLTLFCVNRDLKRDLDTTIDVSGFSTTENAAVKTLLAENIYQGNDDEKPERVVPKESQVPISNARLQYKFPHESVTRIEMRKQ